MKNENRGRKPDNKVARKYRVTTRFTLEEYIVLEKLCSFHGLNNSNMIRSLILQNKDS